MKQPSLSTPIVLVPYVGADDIVFGMPRADVIAGLGAADAVDINGFGEVNEHRGPVRICYSSDTETVIELGFSPPCDIRLNGNLLFSTEDLLDVLRGIDSSPHLLFGFVVYLQIGMTVTGYHDDDGPQRAICLFAKGRFDRFKAEMRPFSV